MKLLVTGGAGYIGSVVTAHLLSNGHAVTVLDNLEAGHRAAVPAGVELVEADLLDADALGGALEAGFDAVLHFAGRALVGESMREPDLYWRVNTVGSHNLVRAMRAAGVRRIVFSSTCAVYGRMHRMPLAETSPTTPVNTYGASKLAVDHMLGFEAQAHGLGAVSLRYFNAAGADRGLGEDHRPETHLIPNALRAARGAIPALEIHGTDYETSDGTSVRDFVHVRDLAHAHVLALGALRPHKHEVFNLGSGTGYSVREVVDSVAQVIGREVPVVESDRRAGDPPILIASNERIGAALGWTPSTPLQEMIADAWEFLEAHPDGYAEPGATTDLPSSE